MGATIPRYLGAATARQATDDWGRPAGVTIPFTLNPEAGGLTRLNPFLPRPFEAVVASNSQSPSPRSRVVALPSNPHVPLRR